jgi:hypothetical protein
MGTAIIILMVIAILGSGMALYVFQNPLFELAYQQNFWNATITTGEGNVTSVMNADILITRDAIYSATYAIPIFVIGILVLWAILSTMRRDDL